MKAEDITPGRKVELAHKGTSFYDPITGFTLSIDGKAKLGDTVGVKTRKAILSGQLLIVGGDKPQGLQGAPKADANEQAEAPAKTAAPKKPAPAKKAAATEEK